MKWDELKKILQTQNSWSGIQILNKSGDLMPTISSIVVDEDIYWTTGIVENQTGESISNKIGSGGNTGINTPVIVLPIPKTNTGTMTKNTTIKLLSGTSIYYGSIAIIEKLWIKYQYALADTTGTWFIYLGTPSYDFASIARALKGNLYTMATEQELIQNKLFGNKVVFINLPEYKDKQVLMLLYLNDGIRLIQIEYSLYHKSKSYLKSLFID